MSSSKEEIVLSRDSKELLVQRFMKVFEQIRKHVDAWNQRTGWLYSIVVGLSEAAIGGVVLESFS